MGYDLHVVDETGNWPEEAGDRSTRYEGSFYFRRNMSGMRWTVQPMLDCGMVYVPAGLKAQGLSLPDFRTLPPQPGDYGDGVHWNDDDEPISDRAHEWRQGYLEFLKKTWDERPGIPIHKFGSNDGWWVTAAECLSALTIWEDAGSPPFEEFMDDWIPFLRTAAQHAGFRVF